MHVVFVEPAFPKNQREFLRGLLSTGARVSAISERPIEALPNELREGLFQFERVRSVVDERDSERVRAAASADEAPAETARADAMTRGHVTSEDIVDEYLAHLPIADNAGGLAVKRWLLAHEGASGQNLELWGRG